MSKKIRWGVLSTASIGVRKVLPAMQKGEFSESCAIASRTLKKARATAAQAGDSEGVRVVRGTDCRSGHGCDLQSAAEPVACAVDDQGGRGRQACAVREAASA